MHAYLLACVYLCVVFSTMRNVLYFVDYIYCIGSKQHITHICDIMLENQITFWSNVRVDQIAFEVVYEKEEDKMYVCCLKEE